MLGPLVNVCLDSKANYKLLPITCDATIYRLAIRTGLYFLMVLWKLN